MNEVYSESTTTLARNQYESRLAQLKWRSNNKIKVDGVEKSLVFGIALYEAMLEWLHDGSNLNTPYDRLVALTTEKDVTATPEDAELLLTEYQFLCEQMGNFFSKEITLDADERSTTLDASMLALAAIDWYQAEPNLANQYETIVSALQREYLLEHEQQTEPNANLTRQLSEIQLADLALCLKRAQKEAEEEKKERLIMQEAEAEQQRKLAIKQKKQSHIRGRNNDEDDELERKMLQEKKERKERRNNHRQEMQEKRQKQLDRQFSEDEHQRKEKERKIKALQEEIRERQLYADIVALFNANEEDGNEGISHNAIPAGVAISTSIEEKTQPVYETPNPIIALLRDPDPNQKDKSLSPTTLTEALEELALGSTDKSATINKLKTLEEAYQAILLDKSNLYNVRKPLPFWQTYNKHLSSYQLGHIRILKLEAKRLGLALARENEMSAQEIIDHAPTLIRCNLTRVKLWTKISTNRFLSKMTKTEEKIHRAATCSCLRI